jgi:hypothetical protein
MTRYPGPLRSTLVLCGRGFGYWSLIRPVLEENERLFGVPVPWLLRVDGRERPPGGIYCVILSAESEALQPDEAWVVPGT